MDTEHVGVDLVDSGFHHEVPYSTLLRKLDAHDHQRSFADRFGRLPAGCGIGFGFERVSCRLIKARLPDTASIELQAIAHLADPLGHAPGLAEVVGEIRELFLWA